MEYIERYEELISDMWEELAGAKKYAKEAMRGDRGAMKELAAQEYNHFAVLHAQTLDLMKHIPDDDALHHVWKHDQKRLMERAGEVKAALEMARS